MMKDFSSFYSDHITKSIQTKRLLLDDDAIKNQIEKVATLIAEGMQSGAALHLCGNGGSAADAQHIAAELSGRYKLERHGLNAEALHVNTSALTAIANDYGFDDVYARLLQAKANKGDILIAISTSGNSENIIRAIHMAKSQEVKSIAFTGIADSKASKLANLTIKVPSDETPIIQESHIMIGHMICDWIETSLFNS